MPGTPGPGVAPPAGVPISAILSTTRLSAVSSICACVVKILHARAAARIYIHIEFAASKTVKRRTDNLGFVADYSGLGQLDSLVSGILLSIVTTSASHERSPASERQFCAAFIHC